MINVSLVHNPQKLILFIVNDYQHPNDPTTLS